MSNLRIIILLAVATLAPSCRWTPRELVNNPTYATSEQALFLEDGARIDYHEGSDFPGMARRGYLRCVEATGAMRWSLVQPDGVEPDPDSNPLAGAFTQKFPRPDSAVVFDGASAAAMAADDNQLYVAQFSRHSTGAEVLALDLRDGRHVWGRAVEGLGPFAHKLYVNRVSLRLADSTLIVSGNESGGDYVETYSTRGVRLSTEVLPRR